MAYFHMKLIPPRASFPFDASDAESAAMAKHAVFWRARAAEGVAIVAGPVFDAEGAWGTVVVEVDDEASARSLADADPVIGAGLGFRFVVSPMPSVILRGPVASNVN